MSPHDLILRAALVSAILSPNPPPLTGCMRMVGIDELVVENKSIQQQVQRRKKVLLDNNVPILLTHRTFVNTKQTGESIPSMLFARALLVYTLCNVAVNKRLCMSNYDAFYAMHLVGAPYELARDETLQSAIQDLANVEFLYETLRAAECILDSMPSMEAMIGDYAVTESSHSMEEDGISLLEALAHTVRCQQYYFECESSPVGDSGHCYW